MGSDSVNIFPNLVVNLSSLCTLAHFQIFMVALSLSSSIVYFSSFALLWEAPSVHLPMMIKVQKFKSTHLRWPGCDIGYTSDNSSTIFISHALETTYNYQSYGICEICELFFCPLPWNDIKNCFQIFHAEFIPYIFNWVTFYKRVYLT